MSYYQLSFNSPSTSFCPHLSASTNLNVLDLIAPSSVSSYLFSLSSPLKSLCYAHLWWPSSFIISPLYHPFLFTHASSLDPWYHLLQWLIPSLAFIYSHIQFICNNCFKGITAWSIFNLTMPANMRPPVKFRLWFHNVAQCRPSFVLLVDVQYGFNILTPVEVQHRLNN